MTMWVQTQEETKWKRDEILDLLEKERWGDKKYELKMGKKEIATTFLGINGFLS